MAMHSIYWSIVRELRDCEADLRAEPVAIAIKPNLAKVLRAEIARECGSGKEMRFAQIVNMAIIESEFVAQDRAILFDCAGDVTAVAMFDIKIGAGYDGRR